MAGAPYGNKNAEKWTFKKSVRLFHDAIKLTNKTKKIKLSGIKQKTYVYDFIGEIAGELGTFKQIFEHLTKRFMTLKRLNNQLHTNIERNCYYNAKKGAIKEATGIINLKSNHHWTDRQHLDANSRNLNLNSELNEQEKQEALMDIKKGLNELNDY